MEIDDGFITDGDFTDEDKEVLKGIQRRDPVTGRKIKQANPLNKKDLDSDELEKFMTQEVSLDF